METLTDADLLGLGLSAATPVFDGPSTNRAALAASFTEIESGAGLTIAVNHFKSKGGNGTGGDADSGDGQGNFNETRTKGAEALSAWLASDPTGSGDEDFLILGDLNAYAMEDPIMALKDDGYTDLVNQFVGSAAYSFVFDGQFGSLDYALANDPLLAQVTGATEWRINADEPDILNYDTSFNDPAFFNADNPFRSSDHDPIIVGLSLTPINTPPSVDFRFEVEELAENIDTSGGLRVANVRVLDPGGGPNDLSLSGEDAGLFELDGFVLRLRDGVALDFETNPVLDVSVTVTDASIPSSSSAALSIDVIDVNEPPELVVSKLVTTLPAGISGPERSAVATVAIQDDGTGTNELGLGGADAAAFELDEGFLYLKPGFQLASTLDVTLSVDDPSIGTGPEDSVALSFDVPDTIQDGGPGNNLLTAPPVASLLSGEEGDDTLIGNEGDDTLNGGPGDDVAVFSGPASNYTIEITPEGVIVTDRRDGGDGSDLLLDIEQIRFTSEPDGSLGVDGTAFDLDRFADVIALTEEQLEVITQFYIGLYNRAPDAFGLFFWATQLANGLSEAEIAEFFINSPEAIAIYGAAPTHAEIVASAFQNFFDREVDDAGSAFWTGLLDGGVITIPQFFTLIDEGAEAPTGSALDVLTLQDQVDIGLYFSVINGLSDVPDATGVLALYDNTDREDSLQDARTQIDAIAAEASAGDGGSFVIQLTGVIDDPFGGMV